MLPTGPQMSAPWALIGPDGTRVVLNDQTDPDYVGMVTDITGFDSPEVRENADDLVQMDGGIHGDFYYGRRPITLTGLFLNPASITDRNNKMTAMQRASNAMRADATLSWVLADGQTQFIRVRRQQPLRISGAWQKDFLLALVAADPRIYGGTLNTASVDAGEVADPQGRSYDREYDVDYGGGNVVGQMFVTNNGNTLTYPLLTITGPIVNPEILNFTTGQVIRLVYTLSAGETLVIDTLNRTVMLGGLASRYGAVDFLATSWWGLEPGINDIRLADVDHDGGAELTVEYRDAWM